MRARVNGSGVSQTDVRQHNRSLALAAVARRGRLTRGQLASQLGLSKPAVSRIVTELVGGGLLSETSPQAGTGPGRPTRHLELPRSQHLFFGVDVRVDGLLVQARDLHGDLLGEARHPLPRDADPTASATLIAQELNRLGAELDRTPTGVGLAVGARLDQSRQVIMDSVYRPWSKVPLPAMVRDALTTPDVPMAMHEVSSAAALANWQELSIDPEVSDLVHFQVGIGTGCGVVRRSDPMPVIQPAPHTAHLPMQLDGPLCSCGARGCLDTLLGFDALVARASATGLRPEPGPREVETYTTALAALVDDGHPAARRAVDEMADRFIQAAAILIDLLLPARFTYGGYPLLLGDGFRHRVTQGLQARLLDPTVLCSTSLGDGASVVGAYWMAVGPLMADPPARPPRALEVLSSRDA